jgi:putative hydrolase of the HAD superfamily
MIKAIFFDLDDTLLWDNQSIQESFDNTCKAAQENYDLDPKQLEEAVRSAARELYATYESYEFTKMIGINPFEGLWGDFLEGEHEGFRQLEKVAPTYRKEAWTQGLKALGVDDSSFGAELAETFRSERRNKPLVYDETYKVLDELKGSYQLLLLTNGSPDLQKTKLDGVPDLVPYFDHIVISGDFGRGKPDPSLFNHALGLLQLKPEEVVMVGDKLTTDILGASRVGMHSVWINRENHQRDDSIAVPHYEINNLEEIYEIINKLNH